jgi:UDP-N-acetylmuramoyl-tripeptide--D-alanyl-D-alanine ligase
MQTSLKMFNDIPALAKRIAVLGTMGELGDYEEKLHVELGKSLVNYKIDKLVVVGKCAKFIADGAFSAGFCKDNAFIAETVAEAGKIVCENSCEGDLILFKGSRSVELEKAISALSILS